VLATETADWSIDLGRGDGGGEIAADGTPEDVGP
jgi:excinuclease UvrABC ATPase subunit